MSSISYFETLALKYWEQAQQDLKEAKSLLKKKDFTSSAITACQAANNGLTSVCIIHKQHQNPNHSFSDLLVACLPYDKAFSELQKDCELLDQINAFSFFIQNETNQMNEKKSYDFFNASQKIINQTKDIIQKNNLFEIKKSLAEKLFS